MLTVCVSCIANERIVAKVTKLKVVDWVILASVLSDFMAIHLLFMVKDNGSWKDIGISLTQYGFVNAQVLFLPIIFYCSSYYLRNIDFSSIFTVVKSS